MIAFNHTLVNVRDKAATASFLAEMFALAPPVKYGPFLCVEFANGVSLDCVDVDEVHPQHYAFLVDDVEFDEILGRIEARGVTYWADPFGRRPGEWNTDDGGRGLYWYEPGGHLLEIITKPYVTEPVQE